VLSLRHIWPIGLSTAQHRSWRDVRVRLPSHVEVEQGDAEAAGVSLPTIKRLEANDGPKGGRSGTGVKIQTALEAAGVVFIDENGGGAGVGLRKPRKDALMEFAVVSTAEWHREFIADFAPQASLTFGTGRRYPTAPLSSLSHPGTINFCLDAKKTARRRFLGCQESRYWVQEFCMTCIPGAPISQPQNG